MRVARDCFERGVLFVVKNETMRGLAGFGAAPRDEKLGLVVREVTIPLGEPSVFARVAVGRKPHVGPWPDEKWARHLLGKIGRFQSSGLALLPLLTNRETVAVLFGDNADTGGRWAAWSPSTPSSTRPGSPSRTPSSSARSRRCSRSDVAIESPSRRPMPSGDDPVQKSQEFFGVFLKAKEFTEELLRENERLRFRVARLESAGATRAPPCPATSTSGGSPRACRSWRRASRKWRRATRRSRRRTRSSPTATSRSRSRTTTWPTSTWPPTSSTPRSTTARSSASSRRSSST